MEAMARRMYWTKQPGDSMAVENAPPDPIGMFTSWGTTANHKRHATSKEDPFYGKGLERPVYFCTGKPQGLGKYKNRATGVASTAGKFSSAFALGYQLLAEKDNAWQINYMIAPSVPTKLG